MSAQDIRKVHETYIHAQHELLRANVGRQSVRRRTSVLGVRVSVVVHHIAVCERLLIFMSMSCP